MAELRVLDRLLYFIFGVIFALIGGGLFSHVMQQKVYGYWRTREGLTVEAQLKSVDLDGGRVASTRAVYEYQFEGRSFTGERVALFKQTREFYRPLSEALASGRTIPVFVDPKAPEFAVINREYAWFPIAFSIPFAVCFLGAGMLALRTAFRRERVSLCR
jgi:hypothetical protein